MSIDKESDIDPKDLEGEFKSRRAEFKATNELQWKDVHIKVSEQFTVQGHPTLQQKWTNELGEEEWRDIPLVISE